jgi:hypothetical protein
MGGEPTERHLAALRAAARDGNGHSVHIDLGHAEECCDRHWLMEFCGGDVLIEAGRAQLRSHPETDGLRL